MTPPVIGVFNAEPQKFDIFSFIHCLGRVEVACVRQA